MLVVYVNVKLNKAHFSLAIKYIEMICKVLTHYHFNKLNELCVNNII